MFHAVDPGARLGEDVTSRRAGAGRVHRRPLSLGRSPFNQQLSPRGRSLRVTLKNQESGLPPPSP